MIRIVCRAGDKTTMETAESIRLKMQSTRASLQPELTQVVQDAQTLMDWKFYIQRFPLAAVGLSLLVGYLIVPQKYEVHHPEPEDLERLARKRKVVIDSDPTPSRKAGILAAIGGLMLNYAIRAGMAYFGQQLTERLQPQPSPAPAPRAQLVPPVSSVSQSRGNYR